MNQDSRVVVLDVGHGNATLIQENGVTVMVDSATRATLRRHIDKLGLKKIDLVVISHADYDHIGGLLGLLIDGFEIATIQLNGDADKESESWKDILQALEDAESSSKTEIRFGIKEGALDVAGFGSTSIEVVSPTLSLIGQGAGATDKEGRKITSNSVSVVLRVLHEGRPVILLAGDMDGVALEYLVRKNSKMEAKFLVFPHHGGLPGGANAEEFTDRLMSMVKPERVIFSHGRDRFVNPHTIILKALSKKKVIIACTQISKNCAKQVFEVPSRKFHDDVYSAGRERHSSCAGTIVISLPSAEIIAEMREQHMHFVKNHVAARMCNA